MIARLIFGMIVAVLFVGVLIVMLLAAPFVWLAAAILKEEDRRSRA